MNIQHDPGGTAGTPISGDDIAHLRALRRDMERGLEAMLELLDALDGDPDLEDTEDRDDLDADLEPDEDGEPSMGATGVQDHLKGWRGPTIAGGEDEDGHDLEATNEDGGNIEDEPQFDDSDLEPSLASPENPEGDQTHWAQGDQSDREGSDAIEDAPAVIEAAEKRQRENWGKAAEAGREAAEQLARMRGVRPPMNHGSNVTIIGPDFHQYMVTRL